MTLNDIINLKVKSLNDKYEKTKKDELFKDIETLEKDIEILKVFLNDFSEEKLVKYDINKLFEILALFDKDVNIEETEEKFRIIKVILNGKYNENLPLDLSLEQKEFIKQFCSKLKLINENLIIKLNNKKEARDKINENIDALINDIIDLEELSEKITNEEDNSLLTSEDFNVFYKIILDKKIPVDIKKEALIKFSEYNLYIIKTGSKKKEESVDINLVIACFKDFGFGEDIIKLINKKHIKEEILKNANLKNIKDILIYLSLEDPSINKYNILNSFSLKTLLTLCIYGDVNEIKERYEEFKDELTEFHFRTPSIWTKKINVERRKYNKKSDSKEIVTSSIKDHNKTPLKQALISGSYEDLKLNKEFLEKEFGIIIDKEKYEKGGISKILSTSHLIIKENFDIYKTYEIINADNKESFSTSSLAFSKILEKIDRFIELGLCCNNTGYRGNYIRNNPSALNSFKDRTYMFLYNLKENYPLNEYYDMIFSNIKDGCLKKAFSKSDFSDFGIKLKSSDDIKDFEMQNFINKDKEIPNAKKYGEIVDNSTLINFDENVLNDEEIASLEKFRVPNNKFIYRIGNNIISRYKVLRIYSILKNNGVLEDDALLYAVTYNSYMNEKTFNLIRENINYNKGVNNGILKRI